MVKSTLLSLSKSMVSLQNVACNLPGAKYLMTGFVYDSCWKKSWWKTWEWECRKNSVTTAAVLKWHQFDNKREKRHCTGVCWWNVEIEQLVTWHALSVRKKMGEIWLHVHSVYWNPQNNVPICRWKRNLLFCLWYWHSDSTDRLTLRRFKKAEQNHIQTLKRTQLRISHTQFLLSILNLKFLKIWYWI